MTEALSPILAEITIEAPIAHVWHVLTSAVTVPVWLGCVNYRPEIGATFHMQMDEMKRAAGDISGATWCDVLVLQEPHSFSFTWCRPPPKPLSTSACSARVRGAPSCG